MGGGTPRAATAGPTRPDHPRPAPLSHSRTSSVIPAQAGTHPPHHPPPPSIHPSPLKGGRLGGGGTPRAATAGPARPDHPRPAPLPHPRAPLRHSCASRNHRTPPLPPDPATLTPEQECRPMPLSPHHRRPSRPDANLNLANADQNLTEVDARLPKVDKGCQKLTPSTPAPTPSPSKTQRNRNWLAAPTPPVSTFAANPSDTPRTNPNKPERCQTPRPDREAARITPDHPEKKKPEHRRRPLAASHPPPNLPLEGGRNELGTRWVSGRVGSCLRRNDGSGARGCGGGERRGRSGRGAIGGGSGRSTLLLPSPLRGGRDGLGKGWSLGEVEHGAGGVVVVVVEGGAVLAGYL